VDGAIELLIKRKAADGTDMANRKADNNIVYSYVHNHKVGAMIVLACQTDFVAKNNLFLQLAKDVCMHIASSPVQAEYVDETYMPGTVKSIFISNCKAELTNKPEHIVEKIVSGKLDKYLDSVCLIRQKFVKDDKLTIQQLINTISSSVGEKIEIKKFIRYSA
jgi:elongation factor Ts